ncbi:MAG: ASKHA domain-containing protein [Bacillota bacterium]|nr:ASKHA domain-containing protein [Bacillota bacterium]
MRLSFVLPEGEAPVEGDFPLGRGVTVWEAARRLGLPLAVPCGGQGLCGKCAVRLHPAPPPTPRERRLLTAEQLARGTRLACLCQPEESAVVQVEEAPPSPRPAAAFPAVVPVDPGQEGWGVAVDLGTTTLSAGCVDLATGAVLAAATASNPQVQYGDDVLARLGYALKGPAAREELRRAVLEGLNALIAKVAAEAGVPVERLESAVVVGNPAMHHLLLGLEVTHLARAPHQPVSLEARDEAAAALGLSLAEEVRVYLPPLVGGFVGSDALAMGLAEGLLTPGGRRLAVDLGTNGEALLATPDGVYACSTAAGPAFEGGGLRCGLRAGPGAVVAVEPGRPLTVHTLDGSAPRGLAGSGVLSAAATLLALGALTPNGRLRSPDELPESPWPGLAERLVALPGGLRAAVLVPAGETATGADLVLTQNDLRHLQLAKGALRAGVEALLRRAGVDAGELDEVLLAGAFSQGLLPENALATGLLPPVAAARVRAVGNAAWRGAALLLGRPSLREQAAEAAGRIVHVPLADDPDFAALYLAALDFPVSPAGSGSRRPGGSAV